jgi:TetR/AcrR family transcriptional regulator, cholesterol catabolism regulator
VPAPPARRQLRERYDHKRAEVLDIAAILFADQGYRGTTMADITTATGLTAGGIYHYFDGKEQLLYDICAELLDPLIAQAQVIVDTPGLTPEETLRRVVRAWVGHVESHRAHMRVFQQERLTIEDGPRWRAVRTSRRTFENLLDGILAAGEDDGSFAFVDRRLALMALLSMINYLPQWFRPEGRLSGAAVADGFVDLLLDGARAR